MRQPIDTRSRFLQLAAALSEMPAVVATLLQAHTRRRRPVPRVRHARHRHAVRARPLLAVDAGERRAHHARPDRPGRPTPPAREP
jgi:hypothetical protein